MPPADAVHSEKEGSYQVAGGKSVDVITIDVVGVMVAWRGVVEQGEEGVGEEASVSCASVVLMAVGGRSWRRR